MQQPAAAVLQILHNEEAAAGWEEAQSPGWASKDRAFVRNLRLGLRRSSLGEALAEASNLYNHLKFCAHAILRAL